MISFHARRNMSPPTVRVNNFVLKEKKTIDFTSKVFIISELALGLNRLAVIGEMKFIYQILPSIYSLIVNSAFVYFTVLHTDSIDIMMAVNIFEYMFCNFFSFVTWRKMQKYYHELNKFDMAVDCKPKISQGCIGNVMQMCVTIIYIIVLFILCDKFGWMYYNNKQFLPIHIIHALEINYHGHLLNLLIPRLRLINHYLDTSLNKTKFEPKLHANDFIYFKNETKIDRCQMKKMMELYHVIVDAYNFLIEAIKWQLLISIIVAFISVLGFCYCFSLSIIRGADLLEALLSEMGLTVAIVVPLFSPCTFGDRVHNEVRRLRELLAFKLYENKLDKSSRNIARTLLAFTKTQDLSFRLLRILNIDISLPFKFAGLLVTYLIILLQFEKVLNP